MIHLKVSEIKLSVQPEILSDNSVVFNVMAIHQGIEYMCFECRSQEQADVLIARIKSIQGDLNRILSKFEIYA